MSEAETPIRANYTFEFADFQVLCQLGLSNPAVRRKNASLGFMFGLSWMLLFGICIIALKYFGLVPFPVEAMFVGVAVAVLVSIPLIFLFPLFARKNYFSQLRDAGHPVAMELTEEGIRSEAFHLRSFSGWQRVRRIETTDRYLLLFISAMEALVFPRRAFASDTEFAAAVAFAKERVRG